MKILGVILLVFASLNFFVAIAATSSGAEDATGQKMSSALLLAVIGGLLFYFGKKKRYNEEKVEKQNQSENAIQNMSIENRAHESAPHVNCGVNQKLFNEISMDNFLGFVVKKSNYAEIVSVLQQKGINYHEYPSTVKECKDIRFSYNAGNISWGCYLILKNNVLCFISLDNYSPNSYNTYQILCKEMSERFASSYNISKSQDRAEGTETTSFISKENTSCFTEIVYDSSPIIEQKNIYIKYF